MLSRSLKRYYGPLRLPMQPVAISLPYTQQLISPGHHCTGSPALDRLSSAACHPCYPGRKHPLLPFSQRVSTGLPHLTRGSASPVQVTRLPVGSLALRPATSPFGNLRPLIAQTPLPRATQAYGQLLGRDFNPQDKRLLLRTVTSFIIAAAKISSMNRIIDTCLRHAEKDYHDRLNTSRSLKNKNDRIWLREIQGLRFSTATECWFFQEEPSGFWLSRPFSP
jgi:hypothetical protein